MEWNVYYHNVTTQKIKTFNIFEHRGFNNDVQIYLKKCKTKEEFAKNIKSSLMYYFWSKAEWEILIYPWVGGKDGIEIKIDVYDQIMNNWDIFIDYIWDKHK